MKKKILLVLIVAIGISVFSLINASAATEGIYTYIVLDNKATITDCDTSVSGDIVIPSTLGGYPVTSIGDAAFYTCSNLTNITLRNGITSIGNQAFCDCKSLTNISIPQSVTSIGESVFYGCSSLTRIDVDPDNSNYYSNTDGVVFNKDKTELIIYPGGKTDTNYVIPDSVTSIGNFAFNGSVNLQSITIPNNVTSIGLSAFSGCNSLTSISIPGSIKNISSYAFATCSNLQSITIAEGVTAIGEYAFNLCSDLENIAIPDSVTSIGNYAFNYCTSLKSVTIPDGVTSIGTNMFYYCTSLESVKIPGSITIIGDGAFNSCSNLKSITIPDGVTSIGSLAFYDCYKLENITIPHNVTNIGRSAFSYCQNLKDITISDSVTSIGDRAFYACSYLKDVYYTGTEEDWGAISIGSDNERLTNATIHFIKKYNINEITIKDMSGNSLQEIPIGMFLTTISFTNVNSGKDTIIALAQYTGDNTFKGIMYIQTEDVPTGSTIKLSIPVDNSSGDITTLKAFCWESFGSMIPMSNSVSFPAQQ
ncbi:MAG: leucine-rich repeat domain-containing protein [Clostridia bacterium]|nr:leucine-rich repeat domain-containing protein [Clostridia bacterium]